jgi:predicted O-methyltransferase YrrM
MTTLPDWSRLVATYANTATHNDQLYAALTAATWADPLLAAHRQHVEARSLGFGDPAFHAMWAALLAQAGRQRRPLRLLEIGVFKGQVISLWALLAREFGLTVEIHALSPFAGQPAPSPGLWHKLRYRLDRGYREAVINGNFYATEDYPAIVAAHFAHHRLDFSSVRVWRGFSTEPSLLTALASLQFDVIYVDGDHTETGARHDFTTFGPKITPGGWLVADDAGCALPGATFWKGHPAVSRAAEVLPSLGFANVLNVGHNRVYQRLPLP